MQVFAAAVEGRPGAADESITSDGFSRYREKSVRLFGGNSGGTAVNFIALNGLFGAIFIMQKQEL